MNYGYEDCSSEELAVAIQIMIDSKPPDTRGLRAYVEVDEMYPGVRIRRITHYTEKVRDEIIQEADRLYDEMKPKSSG